MTKIKKLSLRLLSLLTILMLLTGMWTGLPLQYVSAEESIGIEINSFSLQLISGADYDDGAYVWRPISGNAGHSFLFRVVYSFSGQGSIATSGVKIHLPRRIIKDRSDHYADKIDLAVPHISDATALNDFGYYQSGSEIIVTNTHPLSAAENGYFEFTYETTKQTFDYMDMSLTDECHAFIEISRNNQSVSAESERIAVCIDTAARVLSSRKSYPDSFYQKWNNAWGEKPANADDYYYLEWLVCSYIDATQPYTFTLEDEFDNDNSGVVGYCMEGNETYSVSNSVSNLTRSGYRYDKVLTCHAKETYEPLEQYNLENSAASIVEPDDGIDEASRTEAAAEYIYDTPVFVYPYGNWNSWLYGTTSWQEHFNYEWKVADYRLQEFKEGQIPYIDGNLRFCVYTIGRPYPRTLEENADPDDYRNYGKRSLNYVVTDDTFYFMDNITTDNEEITIPDGNEPISSDDYEIEYLTYDIRLNDARFDEERMRFVMTGGSYNDDEEIHFDAKFNGSDEWIEDVAVCRLKSGAVTKNDTYVTDATSRKISFRENCTGYRVRYANPHFRTQLHIYPYCKLKNSPLVMQRIGDKNKVWLTNTANYKAIDASGRVCFDKDIIGRDYISGFQKDVKMTKTVTGIQNDKTTRSVTIRWKASVAEEYITSDGLEYVQQKSGTFYDLLPIGCEPVTDSVNIKYGDGSNDYLPASAFSVTTQSNYNNTGRTLMTVQIKVPFEKADLTYHSVYSWDSIIDYGRLLLNSIAYETGNDSIAHGFQDDGGELIEADLMSSLDQESDDFRFQYAEHKASVNVARSATFGLTKRVKAEGDPYYSDSANVRQNGSYSYRLRYATEMEKYSTNIILYDSLENYSKGGHHSDFHGVLQGVDVAQMDRLKAAPVVYYSDVEGLDLSDKPDLEEIRGGKRVWKTEEEFGDLSRARAIAIDVRKNASGGDFILGPAQSIVAVVNMKAPVADTSGSADPQAYNEVYISDTLIEENNNISDCYIFHSYTTVNYRIMADVNLFKVSSADGETPVKNVQFTLEGTSDYDTSVKQALYTDVNGRISFKNIEKGTYTLTETAGSNDFQRLYGSMSVTVDESGRVWVDGQPVSEAGYYTITDDPRIHANIYFYKRDFTGAGRLVNGARFELSGQSVYGNDMTCYEVSDGGRVVFYNIEKGTYRLVETEPADNYLPNDTVYKVTVDDDGEFSITVDRTQGSKDEDTLSKNDKGIYMIYNERYHSFTLVKQGKNFKMPIPGAVFELKGVSDYGNEYFRRGTTVSSGALTFNGLEAGVYTLTETLVPEGYQLDPTPHIVEIDKYGNVSIDGLERDEQGAFVVPNKEEGTITVIKKWRDTDSSGRYTNEEHNDVPPQGVLPLMQSSLFRTAAHDMLPAAPASGADDNPVPKLPSIVVSSDVPIPYVFFDGGGQSILSSVTDTANIKAFSRFTGSDEEFQAKIADNSAVRIDDRTTDYHIYAWFDSTSGAVYWWSDARKVYLTDDSHFLWSNLPNCTSIDASGIDTSLLTDMSGMFEGDAKLTVLEIGEFDTVHATTMTCMFNGCAKLERIALPHFNTERVKDMSYMFQDCSALKEVDLSGFRTPKLETLLAAFRNCSSLESIDLSGFDTSHLTTLERAFEACSKLKSFSLAGMDLSSVSSMKAMLLNCTGLLSADLSNTNTVQLEDACGMFRGCTAVTSIDLTNFVTSNVTDMSSLFYSCNALPHIDLSSFDTSKVTLMNHMFFGCNSVQELKISHFDTSNVTNMRSMFNQCSTLRELDLSHFNTSKVTNLGHFVYKCSNLQALDLSSFDTSNVTSMQQMFHNATSLRSLNVSSFDTSNVTAMNLMFSYTKVKNLDLRNFDTSNVTTMASMFSYCDSLESVDVSSFDTSSCTDISWMFNCCYALKRLDLTSFDTSRVTDMYCMFQSCSSLEELDVSSFYTPSNTCTRGMFAFCTVLRELDLSGFVMDNVTDAQGMFRFSTSLTTIYVSDLWDMSSVPSGKDYIMFYNIPSIEGQAGTTYNGGHIDRAYAHIDEPDDPGYFTYKQPSYQTSLNKMSNHTYFGAGENDTSVFSRVCDLSEIKAFGHFEGDAEAVAALVDSGRAVRVDDGTVLNPPIYAWLNDNGTLYWWSAAKTVYLSDPAHCLFRNLTDCTCIDTEGINSTPLTTASHLFENCHALTELTLGKLNVSNLVDTSYMFSGCSSLTDFDWRNFKPGGLTNIAYMFSDCTSLQQLSFRWSTSKVTDMSGLYSGCTNLETIETSIFNTSLVENMSGMFRNCRKLTSVNLNKFSTAAVTDMSEMFAGCESLTDLNTRTFNTSAVTNMRGMFKDCKSIVTFNVGGFDISGVADTAEMFSGCTAMTVLDLSRFTPYNVTDMSGMFDGCEKLATIYASDRWSIDNLELSENMFRGNTVLEGGNGTAFDPDYTDGVRAVLDLDGQQGYLAEKGSKSNKVTYTTDSDNCEVKILDDDTWEFTFSGLDPNIPYYVWEEEYEGYESTTPKDNYAVVMNEVITIVNTSKTDPPPDPTYGSLSVTKLLAGENLTEEDRARTFLFTVTLTDAAGRTLSGSTVYGGVVFRDGIAQLRLQAGQTVSITDIPTGYHYAVTEEACDGFAASSEHSSGTIEADTLAEVSFTNAKEITEEDNTSFTLKKVVTGNYESDTLGYDFTISLSGLRGEKTYTLSNGEAFTAGRSGRAVVNVQLHNGEEITVQDIPVGAKYRITEAAGQYTSSFAITNSAVQGVIAQSNGLNTEQNQALTTAQETADKGEEILVTFTNKLDLKQSLRIKKLVEHTDNQSTEVFPFILEITGLNEQEYIRTDSIGRFRADAAGRLTAEFYLSADQELVFYDLPVGAHYQITEQANDFMASYRITDSNGKNSIVKAADSNTETNLELSTAVETVNQGEEVTVCFSNTKVQHDVSVTKLLEMNGTDRIPPRYADEQFVFTAELSGLTASGTYRLQYTEQGTTGMLSEESFEADADGNASFIFRLKHGQTCTFKNFPVGAAYVVTESGRQLFRSSYRITANSGAVILQASDSSSQTNQSLSTSAETVQENDLDVRIVFTNTFDISDYVLPAAGTDDHRPLLFMAVIGMLIFGALFVLTRRRSSGLQPAK